MRFLDRFLAAQEIRRQIVRSDGARLTVAFWGTGAIEELGLAERIDRPTTVICNLRTGGTNPDVIREILALAEKSEGRWVVRHDDRLHAKVYLFDEVAIVGSSNASANGLAFEGAELSGWTEANILVDEERVLEEIRAWSGGVKGEAVMESDLEFAQMARERSRSALTLPSSRASSLMEAMRSNPEMFVNVPAFLAIYDAELSQEAAIVKERLADRFGRSVDVFEDWADLPKAGTLVCFRHQRNSVVFDGAWERREQVEDTKTADGTTIQVVWRTRQVLGLRPYAASERATWKQLCDAVRRAHGKPQTALCVRLGDVAALL